MKIITFFLLLFQINFGSFQRPIKRVIKFEKTELSLTAKSHVLMDFESREVLYQDNEHEKLFPASMTKMMGMLLVLEAIDDKKLAWTDMVTPTSEACSMGGTQIFLAPNESMSVEDLFKSVAINSANDAIVALGEKVSGSHASFVEKMNKRSKELNMNDTHFANATGFDNPEHYTSAYDMGLLACELLTHNEDILRFTRLKESYIRTDTENPFWLVNTNKLLGHYDGLDGLKTGYTNLAGYNLTATAMREGVRLVSVTMGADSIKNRSQDTVKLLNHGFSKLERVALFTKDEIMTRVDFKNAKNNETPIYPKGDVAPTFPKGTKEDDLDISIILTKDSAPIKADEEVGYLSIKYQGQEKKYPLIVKEDVENKKYLDYLKDSLLEIFSLN